MFYLDIKCPSTRTSLVVQWLRICLPMQGTSKDPTCYGATGSMHQNCQALMPRACALQQEKPPHWKAWPPQRRTAPLLAAARKSPSTAMKAQHSQKKKILFKKKMSQYFKTQPHTLFSNCSVPRGFFWEADLHLLPFYLKHLSSLSYSSVKFQGLSKALEAQPGLPVLASLLASSTTLPFHSLSFIHTSLHLPP